MEYTSCPRYEQKVFREEGLFAFHPFPTVNGRAIDPRFRR